MIYIMICVQVCRCNGVTVIVLGRKLAPGWGMATSEQLANDHIPEHLLEQPNDA